MPAGAKRLMDVEDLVHWACSQELPKRRSSPRLVPQLPLRRGDGELVGRWTEPPGFPSISPMFASGLFAGASGSRPSSGRGSEVHPDALLVEATILGLPARMAYLTAPAMIVDGIGLDVDLVGAFAAAVGNVVNLVLAHGRMGNRPAFATRFEISPKMAANAKLGVWRVVRELEPTLDGLGVERAIERPTQRIRRDLYPTGAYCRLEYDPDPQVMINDRAEYAVWGLAMHETAAALRGALTSIDPMAPAAALFPWAGEPDQRKPPDLFRAGADGVHGVREAARFAGAKRCGEQGKPASSPSASMKPSRSMTRNAPWRTGSRRSTRRSTKTI